MPKMNRLICMKENYEFTFSLDKYKEAKAKADEINGLVFRGWTNFVVFTPYNHPAYKGVEPVNFHFKSDADYGYAWYASKGYTKRLRADYTKFVEEHNKKALQYLKG